MIMKIERSRKERERRTNHKAANRMIEEALVIDERTLYRRLQNLDNFTLIEIEMLGSFFGRKPHRVKHYIEVIL